MTTLPTVFVSHGSPMHAVEAGRAGELWASLGADLGRPSAVLIASAHWETELPMVATSAQPETIHDFGGFPEALHRIRYPAPGARAIGLRAVELLRDAGLGATANSCRGLDHGAWVPLRRMFPAAEIPVAQISIQTSLGADHHLRIGAALAPLTRDNVLIIGSGHMTHNLGEWISAARNERGSAARLGGSMAIVEGAPAPYVEEFRHWIDQALRDGDRTRLLRWRELAPHAVRAHPTPEHFLPLFVALGAAGANASVEHFDAGTDSAVLAMDAYLFRAHETGAA